MNRRTRWLRGTLVVGALMLPLASGCARLLHAVAIGVIVEILAEEVMSRAEWRDGVLHPSSGGTIVSGEDYGTWKPAPGYVWPDTKTREARARSELQRMVTPRVR